MMACSKKRTVGPSERTCSRVPLLDGVCHDALGPHAGSFHDTEDTHDDRLSCDCSGLLIAPLPGKCVELMHKPQRLQK